MNWFRNIHRAVHLFGKEQVEGFDRLQFYFRPSGTEDIVRVYAEAASQVEADQLADQIRKVVEELTK